MNYIGMLLIFLPFCANACLCDCLKSKKQKNRERAEYVTELKRQNQEEPQQFKVSIKETNASAWPKHPPYPFEWPRIRRTMDKSQLNTEEWKLSLDSDSVNIVEILGPKLTSASLSFDPTDFTWSVRPLAPGIATIKAQYVSKLDAHIEDEQTITITVTE